MKIVKFMIILIFILGVIGYGVYHFGTNIASEKLMETVTTELENSGQLEEVKSTLENDPELRSFLEEAKVAESEELPFTTKEEAVKVLVQKIGISELNEMRIRVQEGTVTREELLHTVQSNLTEEEILALKVIAYKELYSQ